MTSIRAIDHWSEREWSQRITEVVGNYDQLGARPWHEVSEIEFLPGVTIGDDLYEMPADWLPPGGTRRDSWRQLKICDDDDEVFPSSSPEGQSLRRSIVALGLPRRTLTGVRSYKPSSWMSASRFLIRIARLAIAAFPSQTGSLWSHLDGANWNTVKEGMGNNDRSHDRVEYLVRQLRELGLRGVISDFPSVDPDSLSQDELSPVEASITNRTMPVRKNPTAEKTFIPFSDEFITQFVSRAMWFQDIVASQLIDCWVLLREAKRRAEALGRRASHPTTTQECQKIIAAFNWRDADGTPLTSLPWPITINQGARTTSASQWPPRDARAINILVATLQALNFCVIAFCAGARTSEILAATTGSLDVDNGRLRSRTFKLVDEIDGQVRDWPLHPAATRALELQLKLSAILRPADQEHIWVLMQDGSQPAGSSLFNINEPVVRAVKALELEAVLGNTRPHAHRWRHTVGRLVALSIGTAPQVLQDLFGHRDLEMTLRYMLSDPEVAQDAMRVAEEAAKLMAKEAILEVEDGLAGGPAAPMLEAGLAELKMSRGEDLFSADDLKELTEVLTFGGRYWQMVRPGVICTKSLGEYGPCNQGRGAPDPGSCRTDCGHRLETERTRRDCEEVLGVLLKEHADASTSGMEMLVANLEGQILSNLKRWDDIRERVISTSVTAARIWSGAKG